MFSWFRWKGKAPQAGGPPWVTGVAEGSRAYKAAKVLDRIDQCDPLVFQSMALLLGNIARFYLNKKHYDGTMIGLCNDLPSADLMALAEEAERVAVHELEKDLEAGKSKWNEHAAGFTLLSGLFDIHSRDERNEAEMRIAARIRSMSIAGQGTAMQTNRPADA
ncbi:MAG: hypothetical protein JXQ99_07975 [Hyphomicrobiaceae bacterium]